MQLAAEILAALDLQKNILEMRLGYTDMGAFYGALCG